MKIETEDIKKYNWEKYWSGRWSLLTASYWGYYYTHLLKKQLSSGFTKVIFYSQKGHTTCYFDKEDRKKFGLHVGQKFTDIELFCKNLKQKADELLNLIKDLKEKEITKKQYNKFIKEFYQYTGLHITPRNIIDFLPPKNIEKVIPDLQEIRLYTEKVFVKTEEFFNHFAKITETKTKINSNLILCCLPEEINDYFEKNILPKKEELERRYKKSLLVCTKKDSKLFTNKKAENIYNSIYNLNVNELKGMSAFTGRVKGRVRIVFDPKNDLFKEGEILVTGMTRPEYLPLMSKASAIVTDIGGILSHAAITARELRKPCIVGTEKATKILKDGDIVEVNADKGIIKILKK